MCDAFQTVSKIIMKKVSSSIRNKSTGALLKSAFSVLTGLSLFLLAWGFSPATNAPVQAAAQIARPVTAIQASGDITLYLPILLKSLTFEDQLLSLLNAERSARSLATLSADNLLMQVAEAHSQDMVNRNFFSHTNPDGLDPGERLEQAGYQARTWGETLGAGYATPTVIFNGWMDSSTHRAILLSPNFTEIGLGYVAGGAYGHYWTAVLATPQ